MLFIRNFQTTLEAPGTLAAGAKIQHLHTLFHGEVLLKLGMLYIQVGGTTLEHLKYNLLGLGTYVFLVNVPSKKICAMRSRNKKPHSLKVR